MHGQAGPSTLEPPPPPLDRAGKPFDWTALPAIKALTALAPSGAERGPEARRGRAAGDASAKAATPTRDQTAAPRRPSTAPRGDGHDGATATTRRHVETARRRRARHGTAAVARSHRMARNRARPRPRRGQAAAADARDRASGRVPRRRPSSRRRRQRRRPPTPRARQRQPHHGVSATRRRPTADDFVAVADQQHERRAIRDAVINGRISPEVAKDPTAMMAIQQRMNAITQMNN